MGIFDRSRSETVNTEVTENRNIAAQETEGISVVGAEGGVTIISTDQNAFDNATGLAERAIALSGEVALGGERGAERVLDALTGLYNRSLDFVTGTTERQQTSLGNTVTALNTIAREQSKSTDERVAEIAGMSQRNLLWIVGGLALAGLAVYAIRAGVFRK